MATRSMIGTYGDAGEWRMRYCHWDGYPDGVGAQLCRIVDRDGIDAALRVLVDENPRGWSSIAANTHAPRVGAEDRFDTIPGYGHAHREGDAHLLGRGDEMDAEWAYAITQHACGAPMIDVWAFSTPDDDWKLYACMDCASGRMLSVNQRLSTPGWDPTPQEEQENRDYWLDLQADSKYDSMMMEGN